MSNIACARCAEIECSRKCAIGSSDLSNSFAFGVDCCEREASLLATTSAISGEDIRTLVLAAVEHRYALVNCPPIGVDWLSDDSSCYVAGAILARDVGRDPRTTSIESRQTKRMDEAFVRRIKRHYVRVEAVTEAQKTISSCYRRSRRAKFQPQDL